jgi:hypothetical protein
MDTQQRVIDSNNVFGHYYIDSKALYMYYFNKVPSISVVSQIDGERAFDAVMERYRDMVKEVHSYRRYRKRKEKTEFSDTMVVLNNQCLIEFDSRYCEILYQQDDDALVGSLIQLVQGFKEKKRRKPLEINLIVRSGSYLDLKPMEIKRTKLDIGLYYEDDFRETDEVIRQRLNKKDDKGIVLLHGLPGTGKTTYLRHLVGKIRKRVMFLSPNIAASLVEPEFIDLLVDNPNTVLIIEDAEKIIMDRRTDAHSAVSNLLNISDGLLADFLNVQLICTFNNPLTMVDSALMRKGRLIARYAFDKLSVEKAQRLSDHFGFKSVITRPMTIAEIANPHEKKQETERNEVLGFKRHLIEQ